MAGFCRNCGSPMADGQGFCTKCGTALAGAPVRPAVQGSTPLPQYAHTAPRKGGGTLIKVLLAFGVFILVLGLAGVAGLFYLGHRFKDKVHQMGLDDQSTFVYHGPVLGGADPCTLLPKEAVSEVAKMDVVRVERTLGPYVGCEYSVAGDRQDLIAAHISMLRKEQPSESQRRDMDALARSFFRSSGAQSGDTPRHPGETPVFVFVVDNNAAKAQMGITRATFQRMSPAALTTLPDLGDEAFDLSNALMMLRKGDTMVRVLYVTCPCTTDDLLPLAKKIAASL